jgi:hypothetical protein
LSVLLITGCTKEYITNIVSGPAPTVEAGNSQTIQLPVNSVQLSGTVTKSAAKIVGYLWSQVSGPNVSEIPDESSTSTEVNGLIEGTYIFQFLAIDSLGLTGVDTVSVLVKPSPIQTISLQPNNNPNEINYINSNIGHTDHTAPELNAGAWTWESIPGQLRAAFQFDLSGIPANATILSAKLTLYSNPTPINGSLTAANSGTNNAFYIRRITGPWTASTSTWATQPPTETTEQILMPHTSVAFLDLVDIDVKNLISRMHTIANYGFKIQLQNEVHYNNRNFCSSKYSDTSKHPKLVVTYQQ